VIPFRATPRNLWSSFGSLGAMAAAVLFTALIVGLIVLWRQNNAIRKDLEQSREFVQLVTSPGAIVTELKATDVAGRASATIAYDRSGHAILLASNLPNVPQGKAYQLWFIVGNKPPMPGKTFAPDSSGKGRMKEQMPREALDSPTFAITLEPAGGSTTPTMPIYLSSSAVN
ncbi:MAG TPA: anti-sigma factor, partial [Pyrinomonadaceae bacterium]|nr:anti-sigma factor [Pyrinomonadaceae bacterium]